MVRLLMSVWLINMVRSRTPTSAGGRRREAARGTHLGH